MRFGLVSFRITPQRWDIFKNDAINFSKDYAKRKSRERNEYRRLVEANINTWEKKLAMINLSAEKAVRLIEKVNVKLDYWKNE